MPELTGEYGLVIFGPQILAAAGVSPGVGELVRNIRVRAEEESIPARAQVERWDSTRCLFVCWSGRATRQLPSEGYASYIGAVGVESSIAFYAEGNSPDSVVANQVLVAGNCRIKSAEWQQDTYNSPCETSEEVEITGQGILLVVNAEQFVDPVTGENGNLF